MDFKSLLSQIHQTEVFFKEKISKTIDRNLTIRNWLFGLFIVEYEQNGKDRAVYGDGLIKQLSIDLSLKGLSTTNLKLFKQFYLSYPQISQTLSDLFESEISQTLSDQSYSSKISHTLSSQLVVENQGKDIGQVSEYQVSIDKLLSNLSFSHFVELIKIKDPLKRAYYEIEAIKGVWSVRELKRQINSLSYERSAAADDPQFLSKQLGLSSEKITPDQLIKTPYVFDFLNLPDGILGSESKLEHALILNLKNFILELGHGFCFEAQQKRIVIGGEYFFIDLVFYHRILKCHIIIELKVDEFSHANAGQLNTYIQYYKAKEQQDNDSPPIGILLCTNKNEELVQYALGGMDENLFVSQYKTALPTTEQLEAFLKEEKKKL